MTDDAGHKPAPSWRVSRWFNAPADGAPSVEALRGKVIALHAFQMLCPGCVSHGVPQTQRIHDLFADRGVVVIGLHTVFEHHDAMTPTALAAFLHEYRVSFPVGVDEPGAGTPLPRTMEAYGLRGTPSLVLIDKRGQLRAHAFGQTDDLAVGMELGRLLSEPA